MLMRVTDGIHGENSIYFLQCSSNRRMGFG
jgi:hypothetical protein